MHVHIDESRQHVFTAEVDSFVACGELLRVDDLADLVAVNADGLACLRLHVLRAV